jgi:hypothetical protein
MMSEQLDLPISEAMSRLRGYAYEARRPLNEVARDVVERRLRVV